MAANTETRGTWRRTGQGRKHNARLQMNWENELKKAGADEVSGDR